MIGETPITTVIATAARLYGTDPEALIRPDKSPIPSRQRQTTMFACRIVAKWSYPQIARAFGRDHSTIRHGVKRAMADRTSVTDAQVIAEEAKASHEAWGREFLTDTSEAR